MLLHQITSKFIKRSLIKDHGLRPLQYLQSQQRFALSTKSTDENEKSGDTIPSTESEDAGIAKFRMPDLDFEHLQTGNQLTQWYKAPGSRVNMGDTMCEIETPELLFDLESDDEGYLAEILVPEGTSDISPGTKLGLIVSDKQALLNYLPSDHSCFTEESDHNADLVTLLNYLTNAERGFTKEESEILMSMARNKADYISELYEEVYEGTGIKLEDFDHSFFMERAREILKEYRESKHTEADSKQ